MSWGRSFAIAAAVLAAAVLLMSATPDIAAPLASLMGLT